MIRLEPHEVDTGVVDTGAVCSGADVWWCEVAGGE
jgi:hypothetical protein